MERIRLSIIAIVFGIIVCFNGCGFDETNKQSEPEKTNVSSDISVSESNGSFEQFAYYKQESPSYRIFVFLTDADPEQMENHAKQQTWSQMGTTMVCYFNSNEGLNSDAITLASSVDAAIDQVWKPTMVARYMHWPTGKETFEEHPYTE